jgi:hypothetical protein
MMALSARCCAHVLHDCTQINTYIYTECMINIMMLRLSMQDGESHDFSIHDSRCAGTHSCVGREYLYVSAQQHSQVTSKISSASTAAHNFLHELCLSLNQRERYCSNNASMTMHALPIITQNLIAGHSLQAFARNVLHMPSETQCNWTLVTCHMQKGFASVLQLSTHLDISICNPRHCYETSCARACVL